MTEYPNTASIKDTKHVFNLGGYNTAIPTWNALSEFEIGNEDSVYYINIPTTISTPKEIEEHLKNAEQKIGLKGDANNSGYVMQCSDYGWTSSSLTHFVDDIYNTVNNARNLKNILENQNNINLRTHNPMYGFVSKTEHGVYWLSLRMVKNNTSKVSFKAICGVIIKEPIFMWGGLKHFINSDCSNKYKPIVQQECNFEKYTIDISESSLSNIQQTEISRNKNTISALNPVYNMSEKPENIPGSIWYNIKKLDRIPLRINNGSFGFYKEKQYKLKNMDIIYMNIPSEGLTPLFIKNTCLAHN